MRAALTKIRRRWLDGDEADDAGRMPPAAGDDDDVVDPADRRATGVEQRQAHHPERVDQLACHARRSYTVVSARADVLASTRDALRRSGRVATSTSVSL